VSEYSQPTNDSDLVPITEAAADPDFFGAIVSPFTARRWSVKGCGTPPVRLQATRIGGRWYTSRRAAREFVAAMADPELYRRRQKSARVEKAKKRLQRAEA